MIWLFQAHVTSLWHICVWNFDFCLASRLTDSSTRKLEWFVIPFALCTTHYALCTLHPHVPDLERTRRLGLLTRNHHGFPRTSLPTCRHAALLGIAAVALAFTSCLTYTFSST